MGEPGTSLLSNSAASGGLVSKRIGLCYRIIPTSGVDHELENATAGCYF